MKKTIFLCAALSLSLSLWASDLPSPSIRVLPQSYGYFDAFVVSWAENPTEPFRLEIVDGSNISVTKNLVEPLFLSVGLTEYQESENSQNYPDSRLIVTLSMFETEIGSTYTLNIPAGSISVFSSESEATPNEEVSYTFTLQADNNLVTLPEPNVSPQPGKVTELNVIEMSWTGVLGSLDLLNEQIKIDSNSDIAPITVTHNGEEMEDPIVSFDWSSRKAMTDGSAGDILVLTLTDQPSLPDGEYIINIPANYLQITDIETGTLYNDEIILSYTVEKDEMGIVEVLNSDQGKKNLIFNINGIRMNSSELKKGIYIINGKKIIK